MDKNSSQSGILPVDFIRNFLENMLHESDVDFATDEQWEKAVSEQYILFTKYSVARLIKMLPKDKAMQLVELYNARSSEEKVFNFLSENLDNAKENMLLLMDDFKQIYQKNLEIARMFQEKSAEEAAKRAGIAK